MAPDVHPVDELLPAPKLFALGLQHVLVMYANAVAVPLILGAALKLPKDQIAILINADLFACGIATFVQTVGLGPFGIRLPVIMGVTAVSISPMLAMAATPGVGLSGIYGAVIVGGLFGLCLTPFVKHVLRFFPAVVTGTIITMIGVVLMRVGVGWAGGGTSNPNFGAAPYIAVAGLVLCVILLVIKFCRGFIANMAVLIGIAVGYVVAIALGWPDFAGLGDEPWLRIVLPFRLGLPTFHLIPCLTMCLVMTIVFIEATGMFLALGEMTGREVGPKDIQRGLRADALGTIIGGIFNTFPYVSYSQNVGLVGVTGGARRRRLHHVRHGRGDGDQDPQVRGLRSGAAQHARRRDLDRLRADPDRLAELLPHHAGRAEADLRRRHHPDVRRCCDPQRLLQSHHAGAGQRGCRSGGAGREPHLTFEAIGVPPCLAPSMSRR